MTEDMFTVFREAPESCRLIVKSDALRDVMHGACNITYQELLMCVEINDVHGGGPITFIITDGASPSIKLSVEGTADVFEAEIPKYVHRNEDKE